MNADTRIWISAVIAGVIVAGVGVADHFLPGLKDGFGPTTDLSLVVGGASVIAGKAIFDQGVQVPTPPKP